MQKTIIFDFDGTLVDSLPVVLKIADEVVGSHNLTLTPEEIEKLRNMPALEIIKVSGIPLLKIPRLLIKGRKALAKRLGELHIFPGIAEVVQRLHEAGHQLCVVSSNSEDNIRTVLRQEGIEEHFDGVYGGVGLFTKSRVFKVVQKDRGVSTADMVYVGDEVRDIEAAKKGGIPIVSVTWGYNGEQILATYHPDYLAHTPEELATILGG